MISPRSTDEPVIVAAFRTPIGKRDRGLAQVHPVDLAAFILRALIDRTGINPADVNDVVMGCNTQRGEQGLNIGRMAALAAGFPPEVPATSINRMCASSDQAVHFASQAVAAGDMRIVVAGGVESMTRVPMGSDGGGISRLVSDRYQIVPQGISAELMAEKWKISREEMDEYSLESHHRTLRAWEEGRFRREVIPVDLALADGKHIQLSRDEGPRPDTSLERLAELEPAFKTGGKITAGNSSQISDGAAAVLIMTRRQAEERGLKPRARILARVSVGADPTLQLSGPIPATQRALTRAGLKVQDLDAIEVNEAFASVVLAWARELKPPTMEKVNPNGGAIALGHPLGATGARLITTLLHELERTNGQFGLSTMCIGHGMANATLIEREP